MATKVEIYSTPTCHYCNMAKDFLKSKSVDFTEYNVAEDREKLTQMREMTGQMGVPVIAVTQDGESEPEIMVGFNQAKLADLVGIA